jgi:hypothetical protein
MADYSIEVSIPNVGPQGPQGEVGPVGPANELTLGEITTGNAGTEAVATISGTPPNQTLDLVLPRGDTGAQGNPGPTGAGGVGVVPAPIYATMQEAVEDGITFGGVFRHTSGSVFWVEEPDPDAATFIAASGATDVWNIQKFVQGVKALGLWDDMVCWPLRSSQNAGTGTTAYSLGGLGTFNGTLVNGPTWQSDGVGFVRASSTYINIPHNAALQASGSYSLLLACKLNDTASSQFVFAKDAFNNREYAIAINNTASTVGFIPNAGLITQVSLGAPQASVTKFLAGRYTPTTARAAKNGGTEVSATIAAPTVGTANVRIGARQFATVEDYFDGSVAFAAFMSADFGASGPDLYTLYKTTLGTSLGLP